MARKCKTCERSATCDLLENTYRERLTYKPFENIKELLEKKKNGNRPR